MWGFQLQPSADSTPPHMCRTPPLNPQEDTNHWFKSTSIKSTAKYWTFGICYNLFIVIPLVGMKYIYIIYHISNKWNHQPAYVFFIATHVISGVIFPFFYCLSGCLTGRLLQGVSQQDPKKLQEQLGTFDAFLSHMEIGESYGNWINYGKHTTIIRWKWAPSSVKYGYEWDTEWGYLGIAFGNQRRLRNPRTKCSEVGKSPSSQGLSKWLLPIRLPESPVNRPRWVIYTVQSHWPQTWMV